VDKDAMEQHFLLIFYDNYYADFLSGTDTEETLKGAVSRDFLLSSTIEVNGKRKVQPRTGHEGPEGE
jgi:hypothetical protein